MELRRSRPVVPGPIVQTNSISHHHAGAEIGVPGGPCVRNKANSRRVGRALGDRAAGQMRKTNPIWLGGGGRNAPNKPNLLEPAAVTSAFERRGYGNSWRSVGRQNKANLPPDGRGRPSARPKALTLPPGTGTTAPNKANSRREACGTNKANSARVVLPHGVKGAKQSQFSAGGQDRQVFGGKGVMVNWTCNRPRQNKANFRRVGRGLADGGRRANAQNEPNFGGSFEFEGSSLKRNVRNKPNLAGRDRAGGAKGGPGGRSTPLLHHFMIPWRPWSPMGHQGTKCAKRTQFAAGPDGTGPQGRGTRGKCAKRTQFPRRDRAVLPRPSTRRPRPRQADCAKQSQFPGVDLSCRWHR